MEPYVLNRRRYAGGKFNIIATGNGTFAKEAEAAFVDAIQIFPIFRKERFVAYMRQAGVPEDVIAEYARNLVIDDEIYARDRSAY